MAEKNVTDKTATSDTVAFVKLYSRADVAKHTENADAWIIIHNNVYNVTSFLNEHPGGEEVLLELAGNDGTEAFEDIGHSSDARQLMESFKVGEILEEERRNDAEKKTSGWSDDNYNEDSSSGSWRSWLIPIALGVLATLVYRYFISAN